MSRQRHIPAEEANTPDSSSQHLEGILERFVFHNEENGWSVARLSGDRRGEPVTAVGNFLGVQPGESLKLSGRWVMDRKYGRQFRVESFISVKPASLVGLEKYLGSGLVKGIGKVMAGRLVKHFELDTLEVIDSDADRLTEVEGIGPVRAARIREAWEEQREIKDVMIFLQSHGVTTTFAIRIYKTYGSAAVARIQDNPYELATDIHGIGFKTADAIAHRLGIETTSSKRARAGVLYTLSTASDDGHLFLPRKTLEQEAATLLEISREIVAPAIDDLARDERVVIEPLEPGHDVVYLKALHVCEEGAAMLLGNLSATPAVPVTIDVERALEWVEKQQRIDLADQQREAIRRAVTEKVMVITGGPGTGKTTLVRAIISILEKKGLRIKLAAPTGRAAKRMQETTGRDARTIHRLLGFLPSKRSFEHDQENPLEADLLVVDEVSMVDAYLFYSILKAVPPSCQLVLVGDVDQLPSVGPGSVLKDVIRSGAVSIVRLREIFRQAQESRIVINAHRVNQGLMPEPALSGEESDFFFVEREEPEDALEMIKELVAERIPKKFGLDPVDEIQVLSPMHRGVLGAANLNDQLQLLLNPEGTQVSKGGRTFLTGDKVMQIRNNYDLGVYNGDIGRLVSLNDVEREVAVRFDDRIVRYDAFDLDELVLAYACSVHKSQGSEYPAVVIPVHTQHYLMLQRNLLYTGLTRGKRLVVLVGTRRAVNIAVRNDKIRKRNTRLAERVGRATH